MNKQAEAPESTIKVVKVGTCPSVSGKSQLTYHVGIDQNTELHFRIHANTASGFFSQDWVSLKSIQEAVSGDPQAFTSFALFRLYLGKSANSPGFLVAALKHEGLIEASQTKRRSYQLLDPTKFIAEMQAWAASGKAAKVEDRASKQRGKAIKGAKQKGTPEGNDDEPLVANAADQQPVNEAQPQKPVTEEPPTSMKKGSSGRKQKGSSDAGK